jgi:hypothetical protein
MMLLIKRAVLVAVAYLCVAPLPRILAQAPGQGSGPGLEARVSALESRLPTLATRGSVAALEGQVVTLVSQLSSLASRVAALEQLNQFGFVVDVNCGAGETIASALGQAVGRRELMVIRVSGVCTENVNVARGRISIVAAAPGAGIQAANPNGAVITFGMGYSKDGYLSLNGLTIAGGRLGIAVGLDNMVFVNGCTISGNQGGVSVAQGSLARISDAVIENNGGDAISGSSDAQIFIGGGSIVRNNTGHALRLQNASAELSGGVQITGNGAGIGSVGLYAGSRLRFGATLSNNARGIFAVAGSQVWLENGAVITGNNGNGVALVDTSVIGKLRATTNVVITNNNGWGISCSASPGVAQLASFPPSGSAIDLSGNAHGQHNCAVSPNPPGS